MFTVDIAAGSGCYASALGFAGFQADFGKASGKALALDPRLRARMETKRVLGFECLEGLVLLKFFF